MMTNLRIRPARSGDWSQLEVLVAGISQFHGDQHGLTRAQFDEFATRDNAPVTVMVAETEEKLLVGYAAGFAVYDFHMGKTKFEIHNLFVHENFRRQRIGEVLMIYIMEAARKKHQAVRFGLGAVNWNKEALEFYRQLGFIPNESAKETLRLFRETA